MNKRIKELAEQVWCSYFHGGGQIKRDVQGCINWQCCKCGRWGTPVPLKEEAAVIDADIKAALKEKNK